MPGASVLALDNLAEYTTVKDNVVWINGKILDHVGMREIERVIKVCNLIEKTQTML